ncbi:MAG: hypothetical protein OES15_05640 [Nitrosopumilus sp.]|nr:hypothetical protein [Nitrosopumilus sp.]
MSKVFRDFEKNKHMKKGAIIGIIGVIAIAIVLGVIFAFYQDSGTMEIETALDRELIPDEDIDPEVQAKLDEIEKINLENEYSPKEREWITSGPFQIDRSKYVIGEKIFLVIGGLEYEEKGQVTFLRPLNDTYNSVYLTVPFDGAKKNAFNYYIQPQLSKTRGLCTIDDIVGSWTVVFRGTDYKNLKFEITDKIIPGDEDSYQPVC